MKLVDLACGTLLKDQEEMKQADLVCGTLPNHQEWMRQVDFSWILTSKTNIMQEMGQQEDVEVDQGNNKAEGLRNKSKI